MNEVVLVSWLSVYCDIEIYWDFYEFVEKLVDVEDNFWCWCFNYFIIVECIIGFKCGLGGISGVGYLCGVFDVVLFFELWDVRM